MNAITAKLLAGALLLLALAAAVMHVRELRARLADTARQLTDVRQGIADRDNAITRLQQDAQAKAEQQARLDRTNGTIATALASVQRENGRLINENATLRAWADTPLPADVVRMSASPALTGATDYSAAVPACHALHDAGDGAAH
ncbi:MAG TPA: Rz-like lysis system protein LysB [Trinickia sp.]|jgi:LysB family phage lysis regulatory protein|nr:Rz-like lysis system protein LysB [Trinickia sp.]